MDALYPLSQIGNNVHLRARGGSHDLSSVTIADSSSMLVILVYHNTCRYASENLKIFRFSKGKRGLGAKTPLSVGSKSLVIGINTRYPNVPIIIKLISLFFVSNRDMLILHQLVCFGVGQNTKKIRKRPFGAFSFFIFIRRSR